MSNAIGNIGGSNHTITVDLSAPAMGINIDSCKPTLALAPATLSPASARWWSTAHLTAALASNETAQISIDGGVTEHAYRYWRDRRYNDSRTLTDGNYLYQVRVIDAAGNVGATDSQNVVIDTMRQIPR